MVAPEYAAEHRQRVVGALVSDGAYRRLPSDDDMVLAASGHDFLMCRPMHPRDQIDDGPDCMAWRTVQLDQFAALSCEFITSRLALIIGLLFRCPLALPFASRRYKRIPARCGAPFVGKASGASLCVSGRYCEHLCGLL